MFNITFLQTFAESAEAYFDPVKHLICSFLRKYLKLLPISTKAPSCMYDKVQNTSLQGFVQDALWKKLAIAPVIECLNSNCLAKVSTTS